MAQLAPPVEPLVPELGDPAPYYQLALLQSHYGLLVQQSRLLSPVSFHLIHSSNSDIEISYQTQPAGYHQPALPCPIKILL